MTQEDIVKFLKESQSYPHKTDKDIRVLQTHISYVFLTGNFAYKMKKPVDFGFVDFTTLKKRKFFCEQELELNRRLCKDLYLDIIGITRNKKKLELNGEGEPIEYVIKMKEIPQKYIMTGLVKAKKVGKDTLKNIAEILDEFYKNAKSNDYIKKFGSISAIRKKIDDNIKESESFIGKTITKEQYDFINKASQDFIENNKPLFEKRVRDNKITDRHGDLHSGNIFIADKIYIFDCIEFNESFRYGDIASDIAFFTMDLDYLQEKEFSEYFLNKYIELSRDEELLKLLNFYKCYRSTVRGKVTSLKLYDSNINDKEKQQAVETAKEYFELSCNYANNL
ncbi:Aminoglycoside phosphotransferase domain-containing protein [Candidatus Magnetomoraceae bacterium gMMP-15]